MHRSACRLQRYQEETALNEPRRGLTVYLLEGSGLDEGVGVLDLEQLVPDTVDHHPGPGTRMEGAHRPVNGVSPPAPVDPCLIWVEQRSIRHSCIDLRGRLQLRC